MLQHSTATRPITPNDAIWTRTAADQDTVRGCNYCGVPHCPDAWDHARLLAGSETIWRETAARSPFGDYSARAAA